MPLEQQLNDMLKDAMRAKDTRTSNAVRMLKTKIMERRTAKGFSGEVDDALVLDVIGAYKKSLQKAVGEFAGGGDKAKEQIEELNWEMGFCDKFLPKGLSGAELEAAVKAAIAKVGATDAKQAGRVVGEVMKEHKGKVDAGDAKKVAETLLTK
jgi:uncharacterized protein YqeY